MNTTLRPASLILVLLAIFNYPSSTHGQTEQKSLVDQLAHHMAVKHQIGNAPNDIRAQFEQNPLQLPAEANDRMLELFEDAYTNELLMEDFKTALRQELETQYREEINQWLSESNTKNITEAHQEFYSLQGKRKRIITKYEMEKNPPSEQRKELISSLSDTTTVAESSVESSIIILRSVLKALDQLSAQHSFSDAQIEAIASNFRSQIAGQANQQVSNQTLIKYHNINENVLQSYIAFWGTETGQWLDKAISRSMQSAYQSAAERFLQSIETN